MVQDSREMSTHYSTKKLLGGTVIWLHGFSVTLQIALSFISWTFVYDEKDASHWRESQEMPTIVLIALASFPCPLLHLHGRRCSYMWPCKSLSLIPHSFVFSLTNRTFFFLIYLLTCNAFYLIIPKADILAMNMAFHNVIIFVLSQMLLIAQNIEIVINYFK